MGLSPSQGQNNLRLYHTTPYHHNHRLDDTKHNQHILHKLQNYSNNSDKYSRNYCSRPSQKSSTKCYYRYCAKRPTYLFENCDAFHKSQPNMKICHSDNDMFRSNKRYLRKSFPLLSNLPFINRDASIVLVNHSPFALKDPRFGIFHHCSESVSYF